MRSWICGLAAILIVMPFISTAKAQSATITSKDGRIQISLPGGYSEKVSPKPTIKLEAVDESAATTILVVSEPQQQFASLAEYCEFVRDAMMSRLSDAQADAGEKLQVAGQPAIRYEITGISHNKLRMAFLVTIIQTETRFNQVIGSCARPGFAEHKQEFTKIAATLKELPPKK